MSITAQQIVKNFAPSWFAAVMGTGVLALGAGFLGHRYPPLAAVAGVLHWFNVALFLLLLLPWTLRWFHARPQAAGALVHPVIGNFVPMVAIALLVLAVQFVQLATLPDIALPLPGVFGVGVLAFGLLAMFWSVTLARSVRGTMDGSLFQPH